jgi:tetratricopeptide (TPR) repeat protein
MKTSRLFFLALSIAVALPCTPTLEAAANSTSQGANQEKFGQVDFPISCKPPVQAEFNRAVAILHSFWYERARTEFEKVTADDPACAMGYWGVAMTYWHPLWGPPDKEELEKGFAAAQKAESLHAGTEREREYVAAISAYYRDGQKYNPHQRAVAYEKKMEKLYQGYPKDVEAACFYALSLDAAALPSDKTYANQRKAGDILEKVFKDHPDHPGAAHYIIHSYDYPALAAKALPAAQRYASIAPAAAHALHMPSHIFTRLGLWQDSIHSNLASIAAARQALQRGQEGLDDELHAMGFLSYAYLQRGEYQAAQGVLHELHGMATTEKTDEPGGVGGKEAEMAVQMALERHDWKQAAQIPVPEHAGAGTKAKVYWARAIGSARSGDIQEARKAVEKLQSLYDHELAEDRSGQGLHDGEVELEEARAWLAQAEGKPQQARGLMRAIAEKAEAGKAEELLYPPVLPAREQLGDLLLVQKQPKEAFAEYQAALRDAPNRFDGIYGAARAAELSGNKATAKTYFAELVKLGDHADPGLPELEQARAFPAGH